MITESTNQALLRALGIQQKNIVALQIVMLPDALPRVSMDCVIDARTMEQECLRFELVLRKDATPKPAARLDVDAMCAAARKTLAADLDAMATIAMLDQAGESTAIRSRVDRAIERRKLAVAYALARMGAASTLAAGWVSQ